MIKRTKLEQAIASRQSTIDKLIGRNKKDKKELQAVIDKKKEPEEVFAEGDRFMVVEHQTILAQVDVDFFALINIRSGNRWRKPIKVVDRNRVTWQELDQMCGYPTTRYWDARKQAKVGEKSEQGKSELKKPKLRDWDYGLTEFGDMRVRVNGENIGRSCGRPCIDGPDIVYGNLIDDLTKTSEGFEMENDMFARITVKQGNACIHIKHGRDTAIISHDSLPEFHRKLGHVLNGLRSKT